MPYTLDLQSNRRYAVTTAQLNRAVVDRLCVAGQDRRSLLVLCRTGERTAVPEAPAIHSAIAETNGLITVADAARGRAGGCILGEGL